MSHSLPKEDYDLPPSAPPPSYEEALSAPPVAPARPAQDSLQGSFSHAPPPPPRPQGPTYSSIPQNIPSQNHTNGSPANANSLLYTNNPNLPFDYPRGYFCSKCKNTGFKERNGKPCSQCWPRFFRNQSYNPNPNLTFRYPNGVICEKCRNTGIKLKNGLSCQDCYTRYAPRNHASQAPITYSSPHFSMQFGPTNGFTNPGFGPPPGPQYLQPGDPRMGGTLCGRCRGSGRVTFFLDQELCLICGGAGRLFNAQYPAYR